MRLGVRDFASNCSVEGRGGFRALGLRRSLFNQSPLSRSPFVRNLSICLAVLAAAAASPAVAETPAGGFERHETRAPRTGEVQTAQTEYRRRFVPAEEGDVAARRWVETPDGRSRATLSPDGEPEIEAVEQDSTAAQDPADVIDDEPVAVPLAPSPRRVPISPAARNAQARLKAASKPRCDIPVCERRYRSFNPEDCTYQPNYGSRRLCDRGDPESPRAIAAWRQQHLAGIEPDAEPTPTTTPTPRPAAGQQAAGDQPLCDIPTCSDYYFSFTAADCTYQPNYGPRRLCTRGDPASASSLVAWRARGGDGSETQGAENDEASATPAAAATAELTSEEKPRCDIPTCSGRYQSFNVNDCTYQPFYGGRTLCTRGDPESKESLIAWARLKNREVEIAAEQDDAAVRAAAARAALAKSGAESIAARAEAFRPTPRRASASVSSDGESLLSWFDLVAVIIFSGFCLHAFVRLWSPPMRGPV